MRKSFAFLITTILMVNSFNLSEALAVQAKKGGKCTKAGSVALVGNKKFTCVKKGNKLLWNSGVLLVTKSSPTPSSNTEIAQVPEATPSSTSTQSSIVLVKYKNCTEVKVAGAAPLIKSKTPELYELNSSLDRDKDGVACEN